MKRDLRKLVTRLRKAQDAILDGKANETASLNVDASLTCMSKTPSVSVWAHDHRDEGILTESVYIFQWTGEHEIEQAFKKISEVIGYTI